VAGRASLRKGGAGKVAQPMCRIAGVTSSLSVSVMRLLKPLSVNRVPRRLVSRYSPSIPVFARCSRNVLWAGIHT
jgi:hypothetical protein